MAFSSLVSKSSLFPVTSKSSLFPVASTKLSPTIGNPTALTELNSLRASQNDKNTHHNAVVSYPLKALTCPSEHLKFSDDVHVKHAQKLKVFKQILIEVGEDPFEGLAMIDAVQRLGIDCHFQEEIEDILQKHYMTITNTCSCHPHPHNLQEVALRFRLLRQGGYNVPADVFKDFIRNNEGKSHRNVSEDIKGLMELYEAAQLGVEGENVLDEAGNFSANLLNELMKNQLDHCQARVVRNTLEYPHHKCLPRFTSKMLFQGNYQGENGWVRVLRELAITEFNMVQSSHQKEIVQVSKWWKDLGLGTKLTFARNQPIKWHIWSMAGLTDPHLSEQRVELTKPISLIYIIDDIFDVHGTLDELTLFTETVNRWDLSAADQLPEYMRICFKALNDITDEISSKVYKQHGYNPVHSLRKAWTSLCNAFLVEAKWFDSGHLPKAEEYLKNGTVSSGIHVALVHVFFLLGQNLTREIVELIDNHPDIISSTAAILRLWDDLGSAKDENQEGKDGSYLHYYMEENQDMRAEDARNHAMDKISDAWKRLNEECLSPSLFSTSFNRACLNLARMVPLMYSYDDNQRLPILEDYIKALLFESIPTGGVY